MGIFDAFKRGAKQGYESGRRIQPRGAMDWDVVSNMMIRLWNTDQFSYLLVKREGREIECGQFDNSRRGETGKAGPYEYTVQCIRGKEAIAPMLSQQLQSMLSG